MSKVENNEVKEYIIESVSEYYENCELFVKCFGKGFARKKLEDNIKKVYTNNVNKKLGRKGRYKIVKKAIIIYQEDEDENVLSKEEIKNDEFMEEIKKHEATHAIFRRTEKECKEYGIKKGTGVSEEYKKETALGFGFNEGLVNWTLEQGGTKTTAYKTLVNIVKQVELGIGSEETMKLNEGNIRGNIAQRLKMSTSDCEQFLALVDEIYTDEYIIEINLDYIKYVLDCFKNRNNYNLNKNEKKDIEKRYRDLRKVKLYALLKEDFAYKEFLEKNNIEDSIESEIEYFDKVYEMNKEEIYEYRCKVEDIIFEKYFKKEFEELLENGILLEEDYKKYMRLSGLMQKEDKTLGESRGEALEFQSKFEELKKQYLAKIIKNVKDKIKKRSLNIEEFMKTRELLLYNEKTYRAIAKENEFINIISKQLYPENPKAVSILINKLLEEEKLRRN